MAAPVPESEVWAALQVDLYSNGDNPPLLEPIDKAYIATLISAAHNRLDEYLPVKLADLPVFPDELKLAIFLDVSTHYFNRQNPILPKGYLDLIRPFRTWTFVAPNG